MKAVKIALRPWQKDAFDTLRYAQYRIINALTGSGKSYLMRHLAISEAMEEGRKAVICIPQEIISASFIDNISHTFKGKTISNVSDMIVNTFESSNKQKDVKGFIKSDKSILICSYQTFITAFKNNNKAFNDMEVYIDETHHIKAYESEEFSNEMGSIVYNLVENKSTHITLSSATIFRGDKLDVLEDSIKDKFVRFNLDIDAYLKDMKYIKGIQLDVKTYDILKPFEEIKKAYNPGKKMIIYVPHVNSQEFKTVGNKAKWVKGFISALGHKGSRVTGPNSNGILTVKNGQTVKILDLITNEKTHRASAKDHLIKNQKNDGAIDVILALGMMKEGANFVAASEVHVFGVRNIKETLQILGRALRDHKGKSIARLVLYVPKNLNSSKEQFKDDVENYIKASLMSMIIEDVIYDDGLSKNKTWSNLNSEKKIELISKSTKSLIDLDEEHSAEEYISDIYAVVEENTQGLSKEEKEVISNKIFDIHVANTIKNKLKLNAIDVSNVDYNVIREKIDHPAGWITLSTKDFGVTNFSELRSAYALEFSGTPEGMIFEAKKYSITNATQWRKEYSNHPEWKDVYPVCPDKSKKFEHVFKIIIKGFSGTPEGMILEAKKYNIKSAGQWINQYPKHPEWIGVYPRVPYKSKKFEHVFEKTIKGFSGTPEEMKLEAEKYNITNASQWQKQYSNHPEWIGVYPRVPYISKDFRHVFNKIKDFSGTPEGMILEAKKYKIKTATQWRKEYHKHPEWIGIYPVCPKQSKKFEHVFKIIIKEFSGTPKEMKAEAEKNEIKTARQWINQYDNHPEWIGVYPRSPRDTNGFKDVFEITIIKFSGTPEGMILEAEKYGIKSEGQWINQYPKHPEWIGVYPRVPYKSKKFKYVFEKTITKYSGTPEEMKAEAEKHGIKNAFQWTKQYSNHPEWIGVFPKDCIRVEGFKHVFDKGVKLTGTPEGMILEAKKYGIKNAFQWTKQYSNHPEWKGVYPRVPCKSKNFKHVFDKIE